MLDGLAFAKAQVDLGAQSKGARIFFAGVGAAGRAIAIALLESGVRELLIHDTDPSPPSCSSLCPSWEVAACRLVPPTQHAATWFATAARMGMADGDPLPVAANSLTSSMFVGDVIAGHGLTPLLRAAEAAGCRTANGDQMVEAVQEMMLDFMI